MFLKVNSLICICLLVSALNITKSQSAAFIDRRESKANFNVDMQIGLSENEVLQFAQTFSYKNTGFLMTDKVLAPFSNHFRLNQTYEGIKIYRAELKVNMDLYGNVLSFFDNTFSVEPISTTFPTQADWLPIKALADKNGIEKFVCDNVFFPENESVLTPAVRLEIADKADNYYETIVAVGGKVLYSQSLKMSVSDSPIETEIDTPATGNVFMPDPLTTSGNVYGSPWVDSSNGNTAELLSQLVSKTLITTFENDSFRLKNDFVLIKDVSSPYTPVAISVLPNFSFNRSQSGFEDVNVLYHITTFNDYVRNTLGFSNICNYQVIADPHALNGADNSNFNPAQSPPRLSFGDGGVDDAEDADVIVHEYSHAISHSAAPNTNNGLQRMAMDEGIGDYFASSYSRSINPLFWESVYTWDGHNQFWAGRFTNSIDHYPEDLVNNKYGDADIWSSVLMEIWGDIGRETTDKLMIQANQSFASNMTMPQAAVLYLQADQLLFAWSHFQPIRDRMVARGLLPTDVSVPTLSQTTMQLINSSGFANGTGSAFVISPKSANTPLLVFDISGKFMFEVPFNENVAELKQSDFQSGMFFVRSGGKVWKVVK